MLGFSPPRAALLGLATLAMGLALGCSKPPARAPNPTRPISERRALEVIARAVKKEHVEPADGRDVKIVSGAVVHVDVGVADRKYGVAYLTEADRSRDDADQIPKKDKKHPQNLVVAEGVGRDEGGTKILVLFDTDYPYDDQIGEEHEQTSITAESALERDVRDFIVRAKVEKWDLKRTKVSPRRSPPPRPHAVSGAEARRAGDARPGAPRRPGRSSTRTSCVPDRSWARPPRFCSPASPSRPWVRRPSVRSPRWSASPCRSGPRTLSGAPGPTRAPSLP